jgi:hypothetical protein
MSHRPLPIGRSLFCLGLVFAAGVCVVRAADAYQPPHSVIHRIVHVRVAADGTSTVTTELARRADTPAGVRSLGEDRIYFRETMSRLEVHEAWSVSPAGERIEVPLDSVRIKDDEEDGDGDSDDKVAKLIYPGLELGSVLHRRSTLINHTQPFPGHFSMRFSSGSRVRVDRLEVHLVHPGELPLQVSADRFEGGRVPAEAGDPDGAVRYRFARSQQEVRPSENSELDDEDFAPLLMFSTFKDYATLAAAYHQRAQPRAEPDEEIRRLASEVSRDAASDRDRVALIRDWINRNIRYLSVHIGVQGWVPHPAPQVLKTRYGDCKDQTALMQAMLAAVGIESTPALVYSGSSYRLPALPQSGAFDHVIVYIPSLDLYVDPTDRYAALGALSHHLYGKPALLSVNGRIVQLPVESPERDFVETRIRMSLDETGQVRGSSRTHVAGAFESHSRRVQQRAQSGSSEERINSMLRRFGESGTGRITGPDPLKHGEPWVLQGEFDLESVVNLPGPAALRIPVGLTRADLHNHASWRPLRERRNPFECSAGRWRDEVELELPDNARVAFMPRGVSAVNGAYRYQSEWRLDGRRVKVTRELVIRRDRGYCLPQDERDFAPVRDVLRRDLLAQIVFGP